jgi:hypothetical protein
LLYSANWYFKYKGSVWGNSTSIEFGTTGEIPDLILWCLTGFCVLLMVGSVWWSWRRYSVEQRRLSRKKVFVIEGRGLRDDDGSPLAAAIPKSVHGTPLPYLLDLRQRKDGIIIEPEELLRPIETMKTWLHQAQKGNLLTHFPQPDFVDDYCLPQT